MAVREAISVSWPLGTIAATRTFGCIAALVALASCGSDSSPTESPPPPPPATKTVVDSTYFVASVRVVGSGNDPNGFVVNIADKQFPIGGDAPVTVAGIDSGSYTATLSGLADNCWTDTSTIQVTLKPGATTYANFVAKCVGGLAYTQAYGAGGDVEYLDGYGSTLQLTPITNQHFAADWSSDGTKILIGQIDLTTQQWSLWIASLVGTPLPPLRQLTFPPSGLTDYVGHFSPDGSQVIYGRQTPGFVTSSAIRLIDATGANEHDVIPNSPGQVVGYPSWSPDGSRIAFTNSGQLETSRPDGTDIRPIGSPLQSGGNTGWSPDGQLVAVDGFAPIGGSDKQSVFAVPALGGTIASIWAQPTTAFDFAWSPTGQQLALSIAFGEQYWFEITDRNGTPLSTPGANLLDPEGPRWSGDGQWIVFQAIGPNGHYCIYVARPDGTDLHLVIKSVVDLYAPRWNPMIKTGMGLSSAIRAKR